MRKILLISNNGMGFYNFKKELIEELLSQGYEVHFSVPYNKKIEDLKAIGAFFHQIKIDRRGINPLKDLKLINDYRKLIKKIRPDLIVSHTIKPNIYASLVAKYKKIPYINNITGLGSTLQSDSIISKTLIFLYKVSLSDSKAIFFENIGNCNFFKKNNICRSSSYTVVPGAGVNLTKYQPEEMDKRKKRITFLFIGRIMKDKGIDEYLEVAEAIKEKDNRNQFQIVGFLDDINLKDKFETYVNNKIINFLGMSNDTRAEMRNADCIVLPSYHEGMSNVLLEGAAMGKPLITTNIHGCKEVVDEGKNGFLCEPKDKHSLEEAVIKFINLSDKERQNMGKWSRQKVVNEFDRNIVVRKYMEKINLIFRRR